MSMGQGRWNHNDLIQLQTIPDSAFEVLDTIKPELSFTGPTTGQSGAAQAFTVQYLSSANTNFSANLYLQYSSDGGATWENAGNVTVDNAHRGPFTMTRTPPAAVTYILMTAYCGVGWLLPPTTTLAATAASRTVTSTRSGNWSSPATWGGLTPPGAGDIAVINNKVIVTANTTIGDGSSSTVLDVTNGTLAVTGATLTIRGNSKFGKYNNCQFSEHLYRLRGVFCWKTQGFQGEGGDATTSGGIMAG